MQIDAPSLSYVLLCYADDVIERRSNANRESSDVQILDDDQFSSGIMVKQVSTSIN